MAELFKTHPQAITRVFLRPIDEHGSDLQSIIANLRSANVEIIESTKAFNILGAKDNCLLIAEFKKDALVSSTNSTRDIILVNPSDAGNLGTIMRSAAAFNYDKITIVTPAIDPYDPKVIRASMGAIFHLNIAIVNSVDELDAPNNALAFVLDENAKPLNSFTPSNQTLIFGNEAAGLPKDFCTTTGATPVFIEQSKNVDSLNLGVAASIAMHYFSRH